MNDVPVKIKGVANHQDFAGVDVAVPDKLQLYVSVTLNHHLPLYRTKSLVGLFRLHFLRMYRVRKMQSMGVNGWRTAHNMPTKASARVCRAPLS